MENPAEGGVISAHDMQALACLYLSASVSCQSAGWLDQNFACLCHLSVEMDVTGSRPTSRPAALTTSPPHRVKKDWPVIVPVPLAGKAAFSASAFSLFDVHAMGDGCGTADGISQPASRSAAPINGIIIFLVWVLLH
ncbi:MAG: hypothetical protein MUF81_04315 [Verrucomicrobia bacterium]|nr:hypothetical protein [Verrucomicrobiota bacterium]